MNIGNNIIRFLLIIILINLFYLYYSVGYSNVSIPLLKKVLTLALLGFLLYISKKEKVLSLRKQYLTLSAVFLIGFIPTCFQYYFMYVIGVVPDLSLGYFLNTNVVNRSAILSGIGLISYFLGNIHDFSTKRSFIYNTNIYILKSTGIQNCAVVLFFIYLFFMPLEYFRGNYGNTNISQNIPMIALFATQFFAYFVIASVSIVSFNLWTNKVRLSFKDYCKCYNLPFLTVLFIYAFLILLSGDRDRAIYTFGAFVFAYFFQKGIRFSLKKILVWGTPILLFLFVMGLIRNVDFNASTSEKIAIAVSRTDNMEMAFYFAITDEFARVVRAQHAILMYVLDSGHQILTVLYEIVGLVPGLGMVFTTLLDVDQTSIVSSHIATNYMGSDHGMGTTCIADLYLSMGVFGVAIFMFFLGYLYRKIEIGVYNGNCSLTIWIFYLTTIVYAVLIGRADMMTPFRHCFYVFIIVYLFNVSYFKSIHKKQVEVKKKLL